jgi:hypothetical protein
LEWDSSMLRWHSGLHPDDGVWAPHWYAKVESSTGFDAAEKAPPPLSAELAKVAEACFADYAALRGFALT